MKICIIENKIHRSSKPPIRIKNVRIQESSSSKIREDVKLFSTFVTIKDTKKIEIRVNRIERNEIAKRIEILKKH